MQKIFAKESGELMLKEHLKLFHDFTKISLSVSRICCYLQCYWIPGNIGKTPLISKLARSMISKSLSYD